MPLEDHLPPRLRSASPTITAIDAGLSGAGVYRVEAAGESFVLKVAAETEPVDDWRRTLAFQQLAAKAGLAPRIVHVDERGRAVLSAFVDDRSCMLFYRNPATQADALGQLGRIVRRIQAIPLPEGAPPRSALAFFGDLSRALRADFPLPRAPTNERRRAREEAVATSAMSASEAERRA